MLNKSFDEIQQTKVEKSNVDYVEVYKVDVINEDGNISRVYDLEIDLDNFNKVDTSIKFIQGEVNSSEIRITLIKNGMPLNLTGMEVNVLIKEGHYDVEKYPCQILDAVKGLILVNVPNQHVDEDGINYFNVSIVKDNKRTNSVIHSYQVIKTIGGGIYGT